MKTVEIIKAFNVLIKEENYGGAVDFVMGLSEDTVTALPRPTKAKIIELLRCPDKNFLQMAMDNKAWLKEDAEFMNNCILQERSKTAVEDTPTSEPAPKRRRGKGKKKTYVLGEMRSKEATVDEAVDAAVEVGAEKVAVEEPQPEPGPEPEKKERLTFSTEPSPPEEPVAEEEVSTSESTPVVDIDELVDNAELDSIQEKLDGVIAILKDTSLEYTESTLSEIKDRLEIVSKENSKVLNSIKSLNMKIDRVFDAVITMAIWEKDITKNTFITAVQAVSDLDES